ncbi:MAG: hypothetical protein ABI579_04985, partial [Candidatus Sumerlaeota bacterium]
IKALFAYNGKERLYRALDLASGAKLSVDAKSILPINPLQSPRSVFALHYESSDAEWRSVIPYSDEQSTMEYVRETTDSLILSSTKGYVECLDKSTGESRWVYSFSVTRKLLSYSFPYGMPATLKESAKEFDAAWAAKQKALCFVPVPQAMNASKVVSAAQLQALKPPHPPRMHFDPKVFNPYIKPYRQALPKALVLGFFPIGLLIATLIFARGGLRAIAVRPWLALVCLVVSYFALLGNASISRELIMVGKVAFVACFAAVLFAGVQQFRFGNRLLACVPLVLAGMGLWFAWGVLTRL